MLEGHLVDVPRGILRPIGRDCLGDELELRLPVLESEDASSKRAVPPGDELTLFEILGETDHV